MDYNNYQKKNKMYTKKLDGKYEPKLSVFKVASGSNG